MPSEQELERRTANELAVLCQVVANNPAIYSTEGADAALKLKLEWETLRESVNPGLREQYKLPAKRADLQKRMASFLSGVL